MGLYLTALVLRESRGAVEPRGTLQPDRRDPAQEEPQAGPADAAWAGVGAARVMMVGRSSERTPTPPTFRTTCRRVVRLWSPVRPDGSSSRSMASSWSI